MVRAGGEAAWRERLAGMVFQPAAVVALIAAILVGVVIAREGGDPLALARIGTRYSEGDPVGSEGYDGQFIYYISLDPNPRTVARRLDAPAYRYQRLLLPLMARALSFGKSEWMPWVLALVGIVSQAAGAAAVTGLMSAWGQNRWYALVYGLFPGLLLSLRLDLPEPLAFGLVAGSLLALTKGKKVLGWLLLGTALFAKETTALFGLAVLLEAAWRRRWRDAAGLLAALAPYGVFQAWLWVTFGEPGLASGGAMATPFELIPLMGLWRIGSYSPLYLAAMILVFGPFLLLPAFWGIWSGIMRLAAGQGNVVALCLLLNSVTILFLPFSTFRETGGLLRFSCGLALSVICFAACFRQKRVLNYSIFWVFLNVFLIKS